MMNLSIIVPIYNTPMNLLERCVESIISQINGKTELILVDDGSTEEYANDLDVLGTKFKSIKVIHQSNRGEGGARNTGIENATGEYLMFVDSDDVVPHGWIEYALNSAKKENAEIVSGRFLQCNTTPDKIEFSEIKGVLLSGEKNVSKIQRDQFLEKTNLIPDLPYIDRGACARLYQRSIIGKSRFKERVVLSTDQIFINEVLRKCKRYYLSNHDSYYYINNTQSISHTYRKDAVIIMMKSLEEVKQNLFDSEEVLNAFYYHVFRDLRLGLQFSCFNNPNKTSIGLKYKIVKESFNNNLVVEARKLPLKTIRNKNLIFVFLMKYNMPFLYTVFHILSQGIKRINRN